MTPDEIKRLFSPEVRALVERYIDSDPVQVALRAGGPYAAEVASQVKYLQRAKRKLPSYYATRCVLSALAFEQSSSEACADFSGQGGGCCIDLTCGLGVDSLGLSRCFDRVVSIERDPAVALLAASNFRVLGASGVEVVNAVAEEFVRWLEGTPDMQFRRVDSWEKGGGESSPVAPVSLPVDLIYVDPDRRGEKGEKRVLLEDCSPNVVAWMPRLRRLARRVMIKCSPLFDVEEAFRLFGPACRVEVVSEGDECKQVVIETGEGILSPTLVVRAVGRGRAEFPLSAVSKSPHEVQSESSAETPVWDRFRWVILPDVALQKARVVRRCFEGAGMWCSGENGCVFAEELPEGDVWGRALRIVSVEPYRPKELKRRLKEQGITRLTILRRDFPLSNERIAAALGVKEGGSTQAIFTRTGEKLWVVRVD